MFYYLGMTSIVLMILGIIVFLYWTLYPYNSLYFQGNNGLIMDEKVKSGGYINMTQNYCKTGDFITTVDRQFVDGFIYSSPAIYGRRPEGCHEVIEVIYIPKNLPAGRYHISTNISYKANPLRTMVQNVKSNEFVVTN